MEKKFPFLLMACSFFFFQAQSQTKGCAGITSEIHAFVKDKKFDEAYIRWTTASKCVVANDTIFADGETILKHQLQELSGDEKLLLVDKLIALYDGFDKAHPGNNKENAAKKAVLLHYSKKATPEEIFTLLDRAFTTRPEKITDPKGLQIYFQLYFERFKSGDKGITEEDVYQKQDAVIAQTEKLLESTSTPRSYLSVINGINALVDPMVSCDKLISFYEKGFDANQSDTIWLKRVSARLLAVKCTTSPFFLKATTKWNDLSRSSKSAYLLGIANFGNRNQQKGLEYFILAASLEKDPKEKAAIFYAVAMNINSNDALTLEYLKKAVDANPAFGKAWVLMAELFANSENCGKTPFEKKAVYLLAAETIKNAINSDKTIGKTAIKQRQTYLQKAPTNEEIKKEKKAGKKITFDCWMKESVTIPDIKKDDK